MHRSVTGLAGGTRARTRPEAGRDQTAPELPEGARASPHIRGSHWEILSQDVVRSHLAIHRNESRSEQRVDLRG